MGPASGGVALRLDRWLWRVRLFKTRSQAAQAVRGGHVRVNGERVKISRLLRPGDRLRVLRDHNELYLAVLGIPQRRGPSPEALACYEVQQATAPPAPVSGRKAGQTPAARRPDKRQRRALRTLKGRSSV